MKKNNNKSIISALVLILFAGAIFFLLNLLLGSVWIPLKEFTGAVFQGKDSIYRTIIMDYRLPQAWTATMAGAGLAVSGLLMQTLFRNPLADPSILGISSGSGLGVAFVLMLTGSLSGSAWWSTFGVVAAAFIGALAVLLLIMGLSSKLKNMVSLILVGIMIAYIASSITDVLKYLSSKEDVHSYVIWGLGSFSGVSKSNIPFFSICVTLGLLLSLFFGKPLNLYLLGDRYAENLGLNIKRCNFFIILISGFLTAVITAFCGPIAFIGLAVPHIARFFFKSSNHRILIPASALLGMSLALLCNLISKLPGFEGNLPINSVNAMIGAPIVIWVIFHRQKVMQK